MGRFSKLYSISQSANNLIFNSYQKETKNVSIISRLCNLSNTMWLERTVTLIVVISPYMVLDGSPSQLPWKGEWNFTCIHLMEKDRVSERNHSYRLLLDINVSLKP